MTAGTTEGAGWVALRVEVPADFVLQVDHGALLHGELFAHGLHVFASGDRPLVRVLTTIEVDGPVRYQLQATGGVRIASPSVIMHERLTSRVLVQCPGCAATTLTLVTLVAGEVQDAAWALHGDGVRVVAQTTGAGAFAFRGEDFPGLLQVEGGSLGREASASVQGKVKLVAEDRLVAQFLKTGPRAATMHVDTPQGRIGCPCAFPSGLNSGGAGAYTFHLTDADVGTETFLVGADVRFP